MAQLAPHTSRSVGYADIIRSAVMPAGRHSACYPPSVSLCALHFAIAVPGRRLLLLRLFWPSGLQLLQHCPLLCQLLASSATW